jgi:hypothetical protein
VRESGSEDVRDERGRVVSRFKYVDVVASLKEGGGREVGASKYGTRSSYRGSTIVIGLPVTTPNKYGIDVMNFGEDTGQCSLGVDGR